MIDNLLKSFGFRDVPDFVASCFHINLLKVTVPASVITGAVEYYMGLKALTIFAFVVLLVMELISGVVASVTSRKQKLSSLRFSRFIFKVFLWLVCFFIINSFALQYEEGTMMRAVFEYLHNTIVIYLCLEYLLSFIENIGEIGGRSSVRLIRMILGDIKKYVDYEGKEKLGMRDLTEEEKEEPEK